MLILKMIIRSILFPSCSPSCAVVVEVPQQLSMAGQPRYNSRDSMFSLCDCHERCFCVWARERACVRVRHCSILQQQ